MTRRQPAAKGVPAIHSEIRALLDLIPTPVLVLSPDADSTALTNPAWRARLRKPDQEATVRDDWQEAIHPEDRERLLAAARCASTGGDVVEDDIRVLLRNGTSVAVPLRVQALALDGDGAGAAVFVILDDEHLDRGDRAVIDLLVRMAQHHPGCLWSSELGDDAGLTISFVSQGTPGIWGETPELLHRDPDLRLRNVLPEDRNAARRALADAQSNRRTQITLYRVRTDDGGTRWVEETISPILDAAGRVIGIDGIAHDVSDRKETETSLRVANDRYRLLFQDAPVMCVITRDEGGAPVIDDCNQSFCATLGYQADELVGRPLADFYHKDSRKELVGGGYQQALDGTFSPSERRLVTRSGDIVDTLLRAVPERDASGAVIGTRAMYVDVTESKRAERALRSSEERYRSLFEESKDVIFISTPGGRLIDINRAGVELFGYDSREEFLQLESASELYLDPRDRERLVEDLAAQGFVKDYELTLKTKQGDPITVEETGTVIRDAEGKVILYRGIIRDVTAQRELESLLRQAQRMEALGQLAGGISHDFNNLLTAILGYVELALGEVSELDGRSTYLHEIKKAGEKGANLIRQLLAFSRQQVLQPRVLDLNAVVGDIDRLLRRTIGEDIELQTDLEHSLWTVKADPSQMEQILVNLAINARDAMPQGGTLTLETHNVVLKPGGPWRRHLDLEPGDYVELKVSDTGMGIEEAIQPRVFEPFFTTKEPGAGTGLGLSTVYGIVQQSGGGITVTSHPAHGSTFSVYLRKVDEVPTKMGKEPEIEEQSEGSETVLVVEDDDVVRELTARILRDRGYRVLSTGHPDEALKLCETDQAIDLLLTDVVLPGMSGMDLIAELRSRRPEIKAMAMSGYRKQRSFGDRGLGSEIPFMAKPFSPAALARRVRQVLDRS